MHAIQKSETSHTHMVVRSGSTTLVNYTPRSFGDLSSSVPDERVPSNVYLRSLFCLLVARPSLYSVHFIHRTVHRYGYEDVTSHTINIQEQTVLQNFSYIYPHVQSQSPRAPPWPSPPACYGLVLPANHYVVASPA